MSEPDRHLIAAAPDLLKAAQWAVGIAANEILKLAHMQTQAPDIGEKIDLEYLQLQIEHWDRIRQECQAAIDKAEGKNG